ncbi:type II toxin-antitoxin system RelE/ParE family toxin [Lonepinella sp. MS14436]|uniref:type II toxin-antitoxin system RelE/ParE family toxin n=1 Tax=Lonepinella sp. MS14436 TaxID=3003619 RepID=UPI0036D9F298
MRLFKTKSFAAFADKNRIDDSLLIDAVIRAEKGLIDANLGGNVIKQRIAKQGQGKSSGYRSLIFYKIRGNCFFVSIFEKNDLENISQETLDNLKKMAKMYKEEHEIVELHIKQKSLIEIFTNKGKNDEIQ